jgi:hypothetical protein
MVTDSEWTSSFAVLRRALDKGLLLSSTEVRDALITSLPHVAADRRISSIAIPTRDRPETLSRLLSGLTTVHHCDESLEVLVLDDSTTDRFEAATRAALIPYLSTPGVSFRYCNRLGRQSFARHLAARTGVSLDLADFALVGGTDAKATPGACRNAALLDCSGSALLFLDDDVDCLFTATTETGLCIGHSPEPALTVLKDAQGLAAYKLSADDPLGDVERLLNITASAVSDAAIGGRLDLCGVSTRLLERISLHSSSVIVAAFGLIGDLAIDSPVPYYTMAPSFDTGARSESEWRAMLEGRLGVRAAARWLITDRPEVPAHCLGVDGHELLPPFMPVLRGEEVVFGTLIEQCVPGALFGHIPRAALHRPLPPRRLAVSVNNMPFLRIPAAVVLARLIGSMRLEGDSRSARMMSCGALLRGVAELDCSQLEARVHSCVRDAMVATLRRLDISESAGGPEYWIRDIHHLRGVCLSSLNEARPGRLLDVPLVEGPGQTFQSLAAAMGGLVRVWPVFWEAASALRATGIRCTEPVSDGVGCSSFHGDSFVQGRR